MLSVLKDAILSLKLKKCRLFKQDVEYLGHIVKPGELRIDLNKSASPGETKLPKKNTQLRSFWGMTKVFRWFVRGFAKIRGPFRELLKKGTPDSLLDFNEEQLTSVVTINYSLLSPSVLKLPWLGLPYTFDPDLSEHQVGCTLL